LLIDTVLQWIVQYGYAGIFWLLVFGIIGLPIPDETLLTFAGYLVYKGQMRFSIAFLTAFCGSMCGITISYWVGRILGMRLIHRYGKYVHFTQEKLDRVHNWFHRIGHWTLTFGYFIPGVRHFTAYAAGIADMSYPEFARFAYSGAFIWSLTFISLGYFFGEQWNWIVQKLHHDIVLVAVVIAVLASQYLLWRRFSKRKKQL
jgi:membrane protein DedA with SNARE-associated domain